MSERKIWKQNEDQILKDLYEIQQIKKWSQIAKIMGKKYGIEGRNGKQCRQRYHNHLKGGINKEKWSKQEETHLVDLHVKYGNRWAMISKLIEGRTQNCVKNMLYSKLRKSVRQLNRFSFVYYRKTLKQIKISFIYRLIEFTQNSYKKEEWERNEQQLIAIRLKNQILNLDYQDDTMFSQQQKEEIKKLIEQVQQFKRSNQRYRGHSHVKLRKDIADQQFSHQMASKQEEVISQHMEIVKMPPIQEVDQLRISKFNNQSTQPQIKIVGNQDQRDIVKAPEMKKIRSKIGVKKMDSLDSNFSLLLVDTGLEKPIQTEQSFTPIRSDTGNEPNYWPHTATNWINASRSYE